MRIHGTILLALLQLWSLTGCTEDHKNPDKTPKQEENLTHSEDNNHTDGTLPIDFKTIVLKNEAAYIPPMCYTKTEDEAGKVHNPCFSCHTKSVAPNYVNDGDFQALYPIAGFAHKNRWTNLFVDRQKQINAISDEEILQYVNQSNYLDKQGNIILKEKITHHLPKKWDIFDTGEWYGYIPDCYFNFDNEGFDKDPKNNVPTGWRAFIYTPFLGTFWPTNGSTDDVIIRLPKTFREDEQGKYSKEIYKMNLSILESLILRKDIAIESTDEKELGYDLNGNGIFDMANHIAFDPDTIHFVGFAGKLQEEQKIHVVPGLFPVGTEFLHSVRYITIEDGKNVTMAAHMKELRYGIKYYWFSPQELKETAELEAIEKDDYPNRLRTFSGNIQIGIDNAQGWYYQGFIEDNKGDLRPQTFEETVYCIGCHSGLGATTDGVFAFPRKLSGKNTFQFGWAHALQMKGKTIPEPKRTDGRYEYSYYLKHNHAGDEFRENDEVIKKFFNTDGSLKQNMLDQLHKDMSILIYPSAKRALELDKAYRIIVKEQSFVKGRDATSKPVKNVLRKVNEDELTGVVKLLDAQ